MKGFDGKTEHYYGKRFEVADIIDDFELNFNLGNAAKYILRCGKKGSEADALRDLEKASAYIMREIDKRRGIKRANNNNNNNNIWSDIRDFIEKSGGKPRTDVIVRWLSKREPEYRKTYDGMIQRGELIKERIDAKKTAIRFATPAEHNNNKLQKNIKRELDDPVEIIRSMFE